MSTTSNLTITKAEPNQSTLDVTLNTALDILDAGISGRLSLSVAGSANVTLTPTTLTGAGQSANMIYEFTGLLTGSISIIFPQVSRIFTVLNSTTGAFTLTVKMASGVGVVVAQGSRVILESDGTNIVLLSNGLGYPQNSQSAPYTLVLSDAGKSIYHPGADTTARTWTIPANSSVAFPIGTSVRLINDTSGGVITIAITTDTLVLMGAGTTGSRSLAASGMAEIVKMTATRWGITNLGGLT